MLSSDIPIIALAVSVVATLLSSFSLVLHWKNYRRDAGRLKVQVRNLEWSSERPHLNPFELTITKIGRRPIGLDSWYVRLKDGTERKMIHLRRPCRLPTKLGEADRFEDPWMLKDIPDYSNLDTVFAVDATDKKFGDHQAKPGRHLEYLKSMPKSGS